MPIPPSRASAIARRASVTVSIAAETIGISSAIVRRQPRRGRDVVRQHVRLGRHEEHVVEGEPLLRELGVEGEEPLDVGADSSMLIASLLNDKTQATHPPGPMNVLMSRLSTSDDPSKSARRNRVELGDVDLGGEARRLPRVEAARADLERRGRPGGDGAAQGVLGERPAAERAAMKPASSTSPAPTGEIGSTARRSRGSAVLWRFSRSSA